MPTMRQQQRAITDALFERGYTILAGDAGGHTLRPTDVRGEPIPEDVREHFERWCSLEHLRTASRRAATAAEIDLLEARLREGDYDLLDVEDRAVLAEGGPQAEALLDALQSRLDVFTDDISAAMSGEDPGLAMEGFSPFPMKGLDLLRLYATVQRGEHPRWGGDRVANGDALLAEFAHTRPEAAIVLAALESNIHGYSQETGLSPDRVRYAVERLREGLPAAVIDEESEDVATFRP